MKKRAILIIGLLILQSVLLVTHYPNTKCANCGTAVTNNRMYCPDHDPIDNIKRLLF